MKYIILTILSIISVFLVSFLAGWIIRRRLKKKLSLSKHVFIVLGFGILFFAMLCLVYFGLYYRADETALSVLTKNDGIKVGETDDYLFLDGKGNDTALIFYPGAKVESEAYLPLMEMLARNDIDCFVVRPPLRFAQFASKVPEEIIDKYGYKDYLLCGHSLGGVVASSFCADHPDEVSGLVLLAAYPISDINDSISLLTVYGSEDLIFNRKEYEKSRDHFPAGADELIIEGGNHAGFGNYGIQEGNGKAEITQLQQQEITANAIIKFVSQIDNR